uniref:Uncharacterized protein n=1 Tax=Nelumbo nucifera TaxID=4432 RepID=A0A822XIE1_NELNU|nr:TPA_asm: hypothetical protein HUJ06_020272 [Nelumbo nucifera]
MELHNSIHWGRQKTSLEDSFYACSKASSRFLQSSNEWRAFFFFFSF